MFTNLVYFLIVLLVYSVYEPSGDRGAFHLGLGFALGVGQLAFYYYLVRRIFNGIKNEIGKTFAEKSQVNAASLYSRRTMQLSILAIVFFCFHIYFLGYKDLILSLPIFRLSQALSGLMGLLLFFLYLFILNYHAHETYVLVFRSRQKRKAFIINQLRFNLPLVLPWLILSALIDIVSLPPFEGINAWVMTQTGQFVFFISIFGVMAVIFPVMIRYLWDLTPLPSGEKRELIKSFCQKNGFAVREIMLWPLNEGETLTAGVMGVVKRFRYLLITKSLLEILNDDELESVLAHELGHVRRHHLIFYLFFILGYLVLVFSVMDLAPYLFLTTDWSLDLVLDSLEKESAAFSFFMNLPLILFMLLYFRFILGAFMRNFERQADLFAASLKGSVEGLVGSLEKIAFYSGQSREHPSWHHFSVAERVGFLRRTEIDPGLAKRHERKVKKMLLLYLAALLLVGFLGVKFADFGQGSGLNDALNTKMNIRVLKAQARRHPENAIINRLLADLYYQEERTEEAEEAYKKSLFLDSEDPVTNNNYAWFLARKENPTEEEKEKALVYARKAASLLAESFILDTLAEAYFINGSPEVSARIMDQALSVLGHADDRDYYLSQKKKFLEAWGKME